MKMMENLWRTILGRSYPSFSAPWQLNNSHSVVSSRVM